MLPDAQDVRGELSHIPEIPMFAQTLLLGRKELSQGWHVGWSLAALVWGQGP